MSSAQWRYMQKVDTMKQAVPIQSVEKPLGYNNYKSIQAR